MAMAHHDNRNRKEDPVARQSLLTQPKEKDDLGKTYNKAGSLWIDCTIGSAIMKGVWRVEDPQLSSRCCCLIIMT